LIFSFASPSEALPCGHMTPPPQPAPSGQLKVVELER
jgi:hypothetical protein